MLPERTKVRLPEIEPPNSPPPVEVRVARATKEEFSIVPPMPAEGLALVSAPKACEKPSRSTTEVRPLSCRSLTRAAMTVSPTAMVLSEPESRLRVPPLTVTTPVKPARAFKFIVPLPDFTKPTELPRPRRPSRSRVPPSRTWNCGAWVEVPRTSTSMLTTPLLTRRAEALASVSVRLAPSVPYPPKAAGRFETIEAAESTVSVLTEAEAPILRVPERAAFC